MELFYIYSSILICYKIIFSYSELNPKLSYLLSSLSSVSLQLEIALSITP